MRGMLYTFYSYKGGVGRSMALANLGMHFYKLGFTTLLIDWDLEAPGLERYFESRFNLDLNEIADRPGLCDMISTYMVNVSKPAPEDEEALPYPPVEEYLYQLEQNEDGSQLLLMQAGRRSEGQPWQNYAEFVQTFDWSAFYKEWEGGIYLEWLRERLKSVADVILIDSRTGVTEMGGVATQHLSDVVVLFCGANLENIANTARMGLNFISDPVRKARGGRPLDIIVAPSRIDDADSAGYSQFLSRLEEAFEKLPMSALDDGFSTEELIIPYHSALSFRETMIVGDPEVEKTADRILMAYHRIASNMKLLAHQDSALKSGIRSNNHPSRPTVFLACSTKDRQIAKVVADYLTAHQINVREINRKKKTKETEITESLGPVSHVLVLWSRSSKDSSTLARVIQHAEILSKPIIPVRIGDAEIPLSLVGRQFIDFGSSPSEGLETLLQSIQQSGEQTEELLDSPGANRPLIYISYSTRDDDGLKAAQNICDGLNVRGFATWLDRRSLKPGTVFLSEIEKALDEAAAMVVLISPSISKSSSAQKELLYMISRNKPIIPIIVSKGAHLPYMLMDLMFIDLSQSRDFNSDMETLVRWLHINVVRKSFGIDHAPAG